MIDILVYLFENYPPDACPEPAVLARKLTAAGFESEEISAALSWLEGFPAEDDGRTANTSARSFRIYDAREQERLPAAGRASSPSWNTTRRSTAGCARPLSSARWPCRTRRSASIG